MDLTTSNGSYIARTELTNVYLKEIAEYPVLTPEEEVELIYKIKEGDEKARETLIKSNMRFVFAVAKRYNNGSRLLDLVQEGNIGLMKAIDSFDVTKGYKFISYAVWHVRREINQYLMTYGFIVKKSNNAKTAHHITKLKSKYYSENGTYPTDTELIDMFKKEFGIKIVNPKDLYDVETISINSTIDGDDTTVEDSPMFTSKASYVNEYEKTIEEDENAYYINKALRYLSERDREIVKMAFGIGYLKSYTNQEIGDELGFSSERIRQIKKSALDKLGQIVKQARKEDYAERTA